MSLQYPKLLTATFSFFAPRGIRIYLVRFQTPRASRYPIRPENMVATFTLGDIPLPVDAAALANKICHDANLTANQLYIKWEAWALSNDKSSTAPSVEDLKQLAAHIRQSSSSATASKSRSNIPTSLFYPARPTPTRVNVDDFFSYIDAEPDQPSEPQSPTNPSPPPAHLDFRDSPANHAQPSPKDEDLVMAAPDALTLSDDAPPDDVFANRTGSGRVEATLNSDADIHVNIKTRGPVALQYLTQADWKDSRYMNDEIPTRIVTIRSHLKTLGDRILNRIKHLRGDEELPVATPEAFFVNSPNVVLAVGRIRVELEEGDGVIAGRINPSSVMLESVDGNLVKLNLQRIKENKQPLFVNPGMIVVVEGINNSGREIDVNAIYDNTMTVQSERSSHHAKESPGDDVDEIMPDPDAVDKRPYVNITVAAGPFTTSANLKYEPLEELVQVITRSSPDVVLLAGPFVDAQHEQISEGTNTPFEHVFELRVLSRLKTMLSDMSSEGNSSPQIVIVPSLEDVHHEYVCPQPAFRWPAGFSRDPNMHLYANPCVLKLSTTNGSHHASIGLTSLPSLQDISADSLCWNKGDRLGAIVSHMLRQRSFYPTFPPSSSVPLDSTFLERLTVPDLETSPTVDVIVVPSRLKAFAKVVDGGAVAVNPGLLCRGSNGGTYAELCVPLHLSDRPRSSTINEERTQVNVVRL